MSFDINELLRAAQAGDGSAEKTLLEQVAVRFRVVVHLEIRNRDDAEDILQEALTAIARDYRTVAFERSFTGWAARVLRNRMLDYYRTRRYQKSRTADLPVEEISLTDHDSSTELKRKLRACLQKILRSNLRYARILTMSYQGQDIDMICQRLAMSKGNVYTTLSRARSLLEHCLETGGVEP